MRAVNGDRTLSHKMPPEEDIYLLTGRADGANLCLLGNVNLENMLLNGKV